MGGFSVFFRIAALIAAAWILFDMITDAFTVKVYWAEWQEGRLPGIYPALGLLFLLLPTLGAMLVAAVWSVKKGDSGCKAFLMVIVGMCYSALTPVAFIAMALSNLLGGEFGAGLEEQEERKARVSGLKLIEVMLEALPQVIM
jgi:hypothetical protein